MNPLKLQKQVDFGGDSEFGICFHESSIMEVKIINLM
jgi:hypothetical protein